MVNSLLTARCLIPAILLSSCLVAPVFCRTSRQSIQTKQAIQADWLRQEQIAGQTDGDSQASVDSVIKRGRALVAGMRKLGNVQQAAVAAKKLDAVQAKRNALAKKAPASPKKWQSLYFEARWAIRKLAFSNPLLNFDKLLFVRRYWPQADVHYFMHLGVAQEPGADLCVLRGLSPDGKVESLINGKLAPGGVGRPDLSFDATKVLFPYAAPAAIPVPFHDSGSLFGGLCDKFDIYEISIDGSGLKRLTDVASSEETEPCYLPNGRIAFTSSRDNCYVLCQDRAPVCNMFTAASDGSDVRRITIAKEGEWYPSTLSDGRILYTRWEYVMKPFESIQNLWSVFPDGTHARLAYGDHFSFSPGPWAFYEARQIPGTNKVLCIGGGHHNTAVGPLLILDLNKNRGGADGFVNLTPEVPFPEMNDSENRDFTLSDAGWYASPWPLSEDFYLTCYSFEPDSLSRGGYGLYLMDRFGNKELIYRDPAMSCYAPIPVAPRKVPLVAPDTVTGRDSHMPARMMLSDVYEGLPGVKRGTVKHLRILESLCKQVHTIPTNMEIGALCGLDPRVILGTVPVESDGSAYFTIPSDRPIFFEALDEDYLEVRRMRSFVSARPGETVSCLGCHEDNNKIATPRLATASSRAASEITPPPWGKNTAMDYRQLVQPVLDRSCISCHDASEGLDKSFDLRGDTLDSIRAGVQKPWPNQMQSYNNLIKYVSYMRLLAYDNGIYNQGNMPLAPYEIGSGVSKLMKLLNAGHKGVVLPPDDWQLLAAWIDCNAPFYGGWDDIYFPGERFVRNRKIELEKQSPDGFRLTTYVDCGPRVTDQKSGGPGLLVVTGMPDTFYIGDTPATARYSSILRNPEELKVQLVRMDPKKKYKLALSWWDYNGIGAVQSVIASSSDGKVVKTLIKDKALPVWLEKNQMPEELIVDLPSELCSTGDVLLTIRGGNGMDVLLSEIWLYESNINL